MSGLYGEFEAFLAREGISKAEFCRVTGFPYTTINSIRNAAEPKQDTVDRLLNALGAWHRRQRARPAGTPAARSAQMPRAGAWAKQAVSASDRHLAAFGDARFEDSSAGPIFIDLARTATSAPVPGQPCFRCGAAYRCEHRIPAGSGL